MALMKIIILFPLSLSNTQVKVSISVLSGRAQRASGKILDMSEIISVPRMAVGHTRATYFNVTTTNTSEAP